MDTTHKFTLEPSGRVSGGEAQYSLDELGNINYSAKIRAKVGFVPVNREVAGTYTVDPQLLQSSNIEVGKLIQLGSVRFEVLEVDTNIARISIKTLDGNIQGNGTIGLLEPQIVLLSLDAQAQVMKFQFPIKLVPTATA